MTPSDALEEIDAMHARYEQWRRDHLPSEEAMSLARDVQRFAEALAARGVLLRSVQLSETPAPPPFYADTKSEWIVMTIAGEVSVMKAPQKPTRLTIGVERDGLAMQARDD